MTAPLATLAFLTLLWLVILVIAAMLDQGLGKITVALKGRWHLATAPSLRPIAVRVGPRNDAKRALRAQPRFSAELRAAA